MSALETKDVPNLKVFSDLLIVEVGGSVAGAYCSKLFADNGARVVLVDGGWLTEAERIYLHPAKEVVGSATGELLSNADLIIESSTHGPLEPIDVPSASSAVRLQISPYGSSGPATGWQGTDATMYAHSGHMHLNGHPDREPLSGPVNLPGYASGLYGFIGAMGALFERERNGAIQVVEVAHLEVMVAMHQLTFMRYLLGNDVLCRMGNRYTGAGQPNALYECADGWVAISTPTAPQVEMLCLVTGLGDLLEDARITSPMDFQTYPELLNDRLVPWVKERTMAEVVDLLQTARVPSAPATPMLGLLQDDHLEQRGFWAESHSYSVPGAPFRFSSATGGRGRGIGKDGGVAGNDGPLNGVRVLDLARVWAGPLAARLLAELGAEVIQIEAPWGRGPRELPESLVLASRLHPDNVQGPHQWNRNGHLIKYGLHKKSVVLDLTHQEGLRTFERLVPTADVLIENYSPRVMPQLGLDEDRLHELNRDLVYMTMPGYGRSGPSQNWVAYGTSVDDHAGLSHLNGYPGETPWKCGVAWPDPMAGLHAASAILIGLWRRPEKGGVTIEGAQFEATLAVIGDALVDAQLAKGDIPVLGNRHREYAPQGVYPCVGDDRWVSLSVLDDDGWRALCRSANFPNAWLDFTLVTRRQNHDQIDGAVGSWSAGFDQVDLAGRLQAMGVAAAPVLDAPGVLEDRQLVEREAFVRVDQPEVGEVIAPRMPIHFSGVPDRMPLRHAALLGEDNFAVLTEIAGLTADEISSLEDTGVVATEPPI